MALNFSSRTRKSQAFIACVNDPLNVSKYFTVLCRRRLQNELIKFYTVCQDCNGTVIHELALYYPRTDLVLSIF